MRFIRTETFITSTLFLNKSLLLLGLPCYQFLSLGETQFLPDSGRVDTAVWMHHLDANKTAGEEARRQLHKNFEINIE